MRILIYGAGVIGSLYASLFSEAGFDVSVYARGKRLKYLQENGLQYINKHQVKKANVQILDVLQTNVEFDFIFLTVREEQVEEALLELKNNKSPNIVTMVNTIEIYSNWGKICGEGRILPAFPGAGGSIENGILNAALTPKIIQPTTFGEISGKQSTRQKTLAYVFRKSHIPYQIVSSMHNWQVSHLGMVVPIADAYYMSEYPERVYLDKKIMAQTAKRMKANFKILSEKKMLSPFKFNLFMICPTWIFTKALRIIFRSKFGHQFMYQHSMNAPAEMRDLHEKFYDYLGQNVEEMHKI